MHRICRQLPASFLPYSRCAARLSSSPLWHSCLVYSQSLTSSLTTMLALPSSALLPLRPSPTRPLDECKWFRGGGSIATYSPSCRNYVDQATALSKNLTYANGNTLILRADDTTVLSPSGPGRDSVRIRSIKTYTTHVSVYVSYPSAFPCVFLNPSRPPASTCDTCLRAVEHGPPHGRQMKVIGPMVAKLILYVVNFTSFIVLCGADGIMLPLFHFMSFFYQ